jgi:hypothetical protein
MGNEGELLLLKDNIDLSEAAIHLAKVFDDTVDEYDVLRFALAGKLRLSVVFNQITDYRHNGPCEIKGTVSLGGKKAVARIAVAFDGQCEPGTGYIAAPRFRSNLTPA